MAVIGALWSFRKRGEMSPHKRACVYRLNFTCLVSRASSTGRCNTIQCIDSAKLPRERYLFGWARPPPIQGNIPAELT